MKDQRFPSSGHSVVIRDQLPTLWQLMGDGLVVAFIQLLVFFVWAIFALPVLVFSRGLSAGAWIFMAIVSLIGWLVVFPEIRSRRNEIATTQRAVLVSAATAIYIDACIVPFHFAFRGITTVFDFLFYAALYGSISFTWTISCWIVTRLIGGPIKVVERGACLQCGYDLTGNQSGYCPECGRTVEGVLVRDAGVS